MYGRALHCKMSLVPYSKALQVVDRGYVLKNGRIALEGTAAELRENAEVKAAYLGL